MGGATLDHSSSLVRRGAGVIIEYWGGASVRRSLPRGALACLLLVPITAGCVVPPPPDSSGPPVAEVLPADARALVHGRSASEVLENPQLRDKVHALFGADWAPPTPGVGKLTTAALQYFERGGPVRWSTSETPSTSRSRAAQRRTARAVAGSCWCARAANS